MSPAAERIVLPAAAPRHAVLRRCGTGPCRCTDGDGHTRLLREPRRGSDPVATVPPIVHGVLRSDGQPLDTAARAFFEPRFGHDFGRVRVHTDRVAAESARAVDATAYTVGADIAFDTGRYAPHTAAGRGLLAHELTHVVQQSALGHRDAPLRVGAAHDAEEFEAARAARRQAPVPSRASSTAAGVMRRQGFGDVRIAEGQEAERSREEAARLAAKGPGDMTGRILTEADLDNARVAVPSIPAPTRVVPGVRGGRFVLHDTASPMSAAHLTELAAFGRRSAGEGPAAYAPANGPAVIAHDPLFGPRRAAATQFERGQDVMVKADREKAYRAVWNATDPKKREGFLDAMLAKQRSPAAEAATERSKAIAGLGATTGDVSSAAAWAVEDICSSVTTDGAAAWAPSAAQAGALETACANLSDLTLTRTTRVGKSVNVEIVALAGSDCRTQGKLTPHAPYTADQMNSVALLYARAAFEARFFPQITTHFQTDKGISGNRCDPRCFRLPELYAKIATMMKHPKSTTYGISPVFGTGAADNVWWHDPVCGGPHP